MKIIVTEQNYKHVAALLRKYLSNGFSDVLYYPTTKKRKAILNYFNLPRAGNSIIKSSKSTFDLAVVEPDFMFEKRFIRIHNNLDVCGTDDEYNSRYRAFVIYCGAVVNFKGSSIEVVKEHPTNKGEKAIMKISLL